MTTSHRVLAVLTGAVLAVAVALVATLTLGGAPATPQSAHLAPIADVSSLGAVPDRPTSPRPANGAVLRSTDDHGDGQVVAEGGDEDGVITLVRHGKAVRSMYVFAGTKPTMVDVPDGTYQVYVTSGTGYSRATHRFDHVTRSLRYADPITFTTTADQYTWWELSIDPVPNGTADMADVAASSVPV